MERFSECLRKPKGADRFEHVGEILQAMSCGHAGGELQFEQCIERHDSESVAFRGQRLRIRKCNRFRLAIARKLPGNEDVDRHVVLRVAKPFATLEEFDVPPSEVLSLEACEALAREQDIDVRRDSLVPVSIECHRAGDRIGNLCLVQTPDQFAHRPMHLSGLHEKILRPVERTLKAIIDGTVCLPLGDQRLSHIRPRTLLNDRLPSGDFLMTFSI